MPVESRSPALNRRSRTPAKKVAATVATTGIATVASGALDAYQTGDACLIVDAVVGTKYTGQSNVGVDTLCYIQKQSATTAQLYSDAALATKLAPSVAISAGAALQFGDPNSDAAGVGVSNIVSSGSVAGGGFGGPFD
jgi:hypothetical protein